MPEGSELYRQGAAKRRELMGDAAVEKSAKGIYSDPVMKKFIDVATETVDEAVQRSAVTLGEIVAAGRKHETHAGALTVTLRPTGRHGGVGFRRGT